MHRTEKSENFYKIGMAHFIITWCQSYIHSFLPIWGGASQTPAPVPLGLNQVPPTAASFFLSNNY
jgi:hypothetical protein